MKKFALMLEDVVSNIYHAEEPFGYTHPYFELDITEYVGEVREGMVYDGKVFIENPNPVIPDDIIPTPPKPEPSAGDIISLQRQILVNTEYIILIGELGGI